LSSYAVDAVAVDAKETIQVNERSERIEEIVPKKSHKSEVKKPLMLEELCASHKIRVKLELEGADHTGGLRCLYRATIKRAGFYATVLHATDSAPDHVTVEEVMCTFFERYEDSQLPFDAWCARNPHRPRNAYADWQKQKRVGPSVERICAGRVNEFHVAVRAYRRYAPLRGKQTT